MANSAWMIGWCRHRLTNPAPLHDELSVKLLFLTENRRKETLGVIRSQRAIYLNHLARLTERRSLLDEKGEGMAVTNLLLLQADMRVRADLAWLDFVENELLQPGEGEAGSTTRSGHAKGR